jgi:hypothetical protein
MSKDNTDNSRYRDYEKFSCERESIAAQISHLSDDEVLQEIYASQIHWYRKRAQRGKYWFLILSFLTLLLTGSITVASGLDLASPKINAGIYILVVSAIVAFVRQIIDLFFFREHWIRYRSATEQLQLNEK